MKCRRGTTALLQFVTLFVVLAPLWKGGFTDQEECDFPASGGCAFNAQLLSDASDDKHKLRQQATSATSVYKPPRELLARLEQRRNCPVLLVTGSFNPVQRVHYELMEKGVKYVEQETGQHPVVLVALKSDLRLCQKIEESNMDVILTYGVRKKMLSDSLRHALVDVDRTKKILDPKDIIIDEFWKGFKNCTSAKIRKVICKYFKGRGSELFFAMGSVTAKKYEYAKDDHVCIIRQQRTEAACRLVLNYGVVHYQRSLEAELRSWLQTSSGFESWDLPQYIREKLKECRTCELCEDSFLVMPDVVREDLSRPFYPHEIQAARRLAGWNIARSHAKRSEAPSDDAPTNPVALWVVGPSAVGKSTVSREAALGYGLGPLPERDEGAWMPDVDAVLMDGDTFRATHAGFEAAHQDGQSRNCVWREAYPILKPQLKKEKDSLMQDAVDRGMNLIVPHTCLNLATCWETITELEHRGYDNHVVLVLGDRNLVVQRGAKRARITGKRYAAEEWDDAVLHGLAMVSRARTASLVWSSTRTLWRSGPRIDWLVRHGTAHEVLEAARSRLPDLDMSRVIADVGALPSMFSSLQRTAGST
eukprot:TRINITY_DN91799_c0_g1_i1.p1 TRINITY_DN91799_c0_g1~~TRINITY_DN91799_c0_g1_i1.p1  ORF type:complete len:590 (+),score=61.77 TRINITY_DN91799_c0_g1_i1:84-1853(+)